jgi:sirohydrochlorin ferrochelatase
MRAMLVMVHGSPREESNDAVRRVVAAARSRGGWDAIEIGYLDVNQPDIAAAVDLLVEQGASEIVAVPYFLHSGKHLLRDLPDALDECTQRHAGVRITMSDYLGHSPLMADILRDRAKRASF